MIATSRGYPLDYKKGFPIYIGNIDSQDIQIFDSGTTLNENNEVITDGGRVLSIVCQGQNFDEVFKKAYTNLKKIKFEGIYYRKDIGHQVRTKSPKGELI